MIATATTAATPMPTRRLRFLRRPLRPSLLRGDADFFPLWVLAILVLNGFLLHCSFFFRILACCCFCSLVVVRTRPSLPEGIPGKHADESEDDGGTHPVGDPGESMRDNLTNVLQADSQAYLPVRERRHRAICQPDPQHACSDDHE